MSEQEQQHQSESGPGAGPEQGPQPGAGAESTGGSTRRESLAELYESMSRVMRENLERAGTLSEEAFERALNETRQWAAHLRENYGEDVTRVTDYLRRDWQDSVRAVRDKARRGIDFERLQTGALEMLTRLARGAGAQLDAFANKLNDRLTYQTGEIAGPGTLMCSDCGAELVFERAERIPVCATCEGTHFERRF